MTGPGSGGEDHAGRGAGDHRLRAAEGFFASTKPTLINHALTANRLSALVDERAAIINTYRNNTTDLTGVWKTMDGLNYTTDVVAFRAAIDAVPSTFLELYDLTENSPTGQH